MAGTNIGDQTWLNGDGHLRPTWADTEHERTAVPHKENPFLQKGQHNEQLQGLLMDSVMGKAMNDHIEDLVGPQERAQQLEPTIQAKNNKQVEEDAGSEASQDDQPLDIDDDLEAIRAKRRMEFMLKKQQEEENKSKGHGEYEIIKEDEFLAKVTASKRVICHFYHRDFERSKIMDEHLKKIAKKYMGVKVMAIDAEKAPFFVAKLAIRTLPTVALFIDGVAVHKILGFFDVGGEDDFPTVNLAKVIAAWDVIEGDVDTDEEFE